MSIRSARAVQPRLEHGAAGRRVAAIHGGWSRSLRNVSHASPSPFDPQDEAVARVLLAPRLPARWKSLDSAYRIRPLLGTGGDFIEFLDRGPAGLGLAVGDVSGKGHRAALVAEVVKARLREVAARTQDAVSMMELLDTEVGGDLAEAGLFATLFYLELDLAAGVLRTIDFGHSYAFLTQPGRIPRGLHCATGGNTPLGVELAPTPRVESQPVSPGDLILVATDGLFEARSLSGERIGMRVISVLPEAGRDLPADRLADDLESRLHHHLAGGRLDDDYALVVFRVPEGPRSSPDPDAPPGDG